MYYFLQLSENAQKWPNGRTILFLAISFKKAKWQPRDIFHFPQLRKTENQVKKKFKIIFRKILYRKYFKAKREILFLLKKAYQI